MDAENLTFSALTLVEEKKLRSLEEEFMRATGKSIVLLALDKK